jgi:CarD family transcriptional regulator
MIFMVQKKSVSVKPASKASTKEKAKKKTVAAKTVAAKAAPQKKTTTKVTTKSSSTSKPAAKKAVTKTTATKATAPKKATATVTKSASTARKPAATTKKAAAVGRSPAAKTPAKKVAAAKAPATKKVKAVAAAVAKSVAKQSTPVAEAKPAATPAAAQPAKAVVPPKPAANKHHGFKTEEYVVYPAHGVGQIVAIEEQEIAGHSLELFVITFEKDKMTLRVPVGNHANVGMRKLAEANVLEKAMTTLKGRARVKRTMWSRRAQEYEAKINSGDLVSIAEVVRDLYRSETQPEQSYSERQLYEQALDRMARELAVVESLDERGAVQRITDVLSKSAKGRRAAEEAAEAAAAAQDDVEAA